MLTFNDGELGEIHVMEAEETIGAEKEKTPTKKTTTNRKKSKDGKDEEKDKDKEGKKLETVVEEPKKEDKPAQPIAFRRKPKEAAKPAQKEASKATLKPREDDTPAQKDESKATPIEIRHKPREEEKPAQPIAIKRKPKAPDTDTTVEEKGSKEDESRKRPRSDSLERDVTSAESKPIAVRRIALEAGDPKSGVIIKEIPPKNASSDEKIVQPAKEIIIETEKIICSDEKFDSPSRKNRPVTPIAVRRHPRTPDVTPSSSVSEPSDRDSTPKTGAKSAATPIAVRRQPRSLASGSKSSESASSRSKPTIEEDAVDTWPIDQPKPVVRAVINNSSLGDSDQTEDFKLVISDDEDQPTATEVKDSDNDGGADSESDKANGKDKGQSTPVATATTPKTPRRVEFRTLSTPKSKKKLL